MSQFFRCGDTNNAHTRFYAVWIHAEFIYFHLSERLSTYPKLALLLESDLKILKNQTEPCGGEKNKKT